MMLDLEGGSMNPAPAWALSVAELEGIGLSQQQAKRVAGISPSFALDGQWVVLVDEQPYEAESARVVLIDGAEATCSSGVKGTVTRLPKKAMIRFPAADDEHDEECLVITIADAGDFTMGNAYRGRDLPPGDPGELWRVLDEAEGDDPRHDELPAADNIWLYRIETVEDRLADRKARVLAAVEDEGEW